MMLLIDYVTIIPVRLIAIPQVVPPFPIADVVGFELILVLIFISNISEISTLFYLLTLAKLMSVIGCRLNQSMQHLISNYREEGVENEAANG